MIAQFIFMEQFLGKHQLIYASLTMFIVEPFIVQHALPRWKIQMQFCFLKVSNRDIEVWFCIMNLTSIMTTVPIVSN